ncbi:MAG: hypothetical protein ABR616_19705 [Dermatophilaceae bacterium]|nr:hypothetical protein [Intrasporangiaceae bacterium]
MLQLSLLSLLEPDTQQPRETASNEEPQSDLVARRKRRSPRVTGGVVQCGWCGQSTPIPFRGRVPKWCSSSCRHRAWEQRRAAASGLCAVEVVDREIETVTVKTVIKPEPVTVHVERRPQSATEFAQVLLDLAHRLDTGRIYDRDLATLDAPITALLDALLRRRKASTRGW